MRSNGKAKKLLSFLENIKKAKEIPRQQQLMESADLILESTLSAEHEKIIADIAVKICKTAGKICRETVFDNDIVPISQFKVISRKNAVYQQALELYEFAEQWVNKMSAQSSRRKWLLPQIKENIVKFKALITARDIILEVLNTPLTAYPNNLLAFATLASWSQIILKRSKIMPVDMETDTVIKPQREIICEFLQQYPQHECNLLKIDSREDPDTGLEAAEIINQFLINYRTLGFFSGIALLSTSTEPKEASAPPRIGV